MDPNETLTKLREFLDLAKSNDPADFGDTAWEEAIEGLVEKIEALDQWLSRGGFLPEAWCTCDEHGVHVRDCARKHWKG